MKKFGKNKLFIHFFKVAYPVELFDFNFQIEFDVSRHPKLFNAQLRVYEHETRKILFYWIDLRTQLGKICGSKLILLVVTVI